MDNRGNSGPSSPPPIRTEGHSIDIIVLFDGAPMMHERADSHPSQIGNTLRDVAKLMVEVGDQADREYLAAGEQIQ